MEKIILIKYGELTTKKANRNLFIDLLYKNICEKLKNEDVQIVRNRVRMFIKTTQREEDIVKKLQEVFGIHGIVIAYVVNTNVDDIKNAVLDIIRDIDFKTFKVETKRSDKKFSISSMEFNNLIGGLVLKNKINTKVDVHNPEYILKIEIRENNTYIYYKEYAGLGGYPNKIAGKGLLMLSGGIDSPVAGFQAIKRGIELECIYFESPPHTSDAAKNKVKKLVKKLCKYQTNIRLHVIKFSDIQEEIYKNIDPSYMITIMRRMMYRISEKVAKENNDLVIINGESVGQVASQTLNSMQVINNVTNYPILRPVCCLDKLEIIDIAKKIDTYEISILPYEDCCTIFLPKHPVINPNLEKAINYENLINYKILIDKCVNNREIIDINSQYTEFDV